MTPGAKKKHPLRGSETACRVATTSEARRRTERFIVTKFKSLVGTIKKNQKKKKTIRLAGGKK